MQWLPELPLSRHLVNVLGVVGIEIAGEYDLATVLACGLSLPRTAHSISRPLILAQRSLYDRTRTPDRRQLRMFFTGYFADTNRRALISRFYNSGNPSLDSTSAKLML